MTTEQLLSLQDSVSSFSTGFKNTLDSVAEEYRLTFEPDVTFLNVVVKAINLTWRLPRAAVQVSLSEGLRFDSNDLPGKNHSTTKSIAIPSIIIRCLLAQIHENSRRADEWFEVACASFDVYTDIYGAPPNWRENALQQKLFVQSQDSVTGRAAWVYDPYALQQSGNEMWSVFTALTHRIS